jgi:hypothetical protein
MCISQYLAAFSTSIQDQPRHGHGHSVLLTETRPGKKLGCPPHTSAVCILLLAHHHLFLSLCLSSWRALPRVIELCASWFEGKPYAISIAPLSTYPRLSGLADETETPRCARPRGVPSRLVSQSHPEFDVPFTAHRGQNGHSWEAPNADIKDVCSPNCARTHLRLGVVTACIGSRIPL